MSCDDEDEISPELAAAMAYADAHPPGPKALAHAEMLARRYGLAEEEEE